MSWTVCPTLRLLLGMVVDLEDALGRASSSWCLEKPTTPNDRRSAHLPGRTQAGQSYLPGRGGRSHRGIGRWWGSAGLHRGERACSDGLLRIRLVSGDGGQTMLRMTRPARRPPYLELERAEPDLYRVVPSREGLGRS